MFLVFKSTISLSIRPPCIGPLGSFVDGPIVALDRLLAGILGLAGFFITQSGKIQNPCFSDPLGTVVANVM